MTRLKKLSPLPADLDKQDPIGRLILRQTALIVILLGLLGSVSAFAAVVGFRSLSSSSITRDYGARSACITDLRSVEAARAYKTTDAVLFRLAVLDGIDPTTGQRIVDEGERDRLALKYVRDGLAYSIERVEASRDLEQPRLNELCGEPVGKPKG